MIEERSSSPNPGQSPSEQESKPVAQPAEHSAEAASAAATQAKASSPVSEEPPVAQPSTAALNASESAKRPADPASADDLLTTRLPGHEAADADVLSDSRRHTRRSFAIAAVAAAAGYGFYHYVTDGPADNDQPIPRRDAFRFNAALSRDVTGDRALAPTYPLSRAETLRVNGIIGLNRELLPESWRLQLVGADQPQRSPRYVPDVTAWEYRYSNASTHEDPGHDTKIAPGNLMNALQGRPAEDDNHTGRPPRGMAEAGESDSTLHRGTPGLLLTMPDIVQLPRHELVTQFKCIEGWSQIVHWAGVRMRDFLDLYPPALINGRPPKYVYMETPDGDYYTGYDMEVCRHPQTLLVTEMMGAPLTQFHGSPLRLHMPTKYGYKQIKRIALIAYTDEKPDDYWTRLGYDWYAGL